MCLSLKYNSQHNKSTINEGMETPGRENPGASGGIEIKVIDKMLNTAEGSETTGSGSVPQQQEKEGAQDRT